jgi:cystathionine gamma-synthase
MAAEWSRESLLVALGRPDRAGEAVNAALTLTSTYRAGGEYVYARDGTPTWAQLEAVIGALEGGGAVAFASGMAAAVAVLETLPGGARVAVSQVAYHGVHALLEERETAGRLTHVRVDALDLAAVESACEGAQLLWLESPMNPLIAIADIATLSTTAHARGAAVVVDSTLATPLRQQPLDLGADLVLHSATKYIGGHSDLLLGIVAAKEQARIEALLHRRQIDGSTPGSLEAFLALRGVRTLAVRLERAERNAAELARRLDAHPSVARVRYPGLERDPGHALAASQMSGFGAMLAFETTGDGAAAERVCDAVELITHATSLGGVETLLERRARYAAEEASGTPPTLIRLSVGIEDLEDLWRDLERALAAI